MALQSVSAADLVSEFELIPTSSQVQELALKVFKITEAEFDAISKLNFLPSHKDFKVSSERLWEYQLTYLALNTGCPLTQEHQEAFLNSKKCAKTTKSWLTNGLPTNHAAIVGVSALGIASACTSLPAVPASKLAVGTLSVLASIGQFFVNNISYYVAWQATGTLPDKSSRADDEKFYAITNASQQMLNLSWKIIQVYFKHTSRSHRNAVKQFALTLPLDRIASIIKNDFQSPPEIITPLQDTVEWLNNKTQPNNAILLNWIKQREHNKKHS